MNLIDVLATGIRSAVSGTAVVYSRGTTTQAAVYADFAGKARRWGVLQLDSFGSAQAYVDEVVDVAVYDADGALVLEFTEGSSDRCVEVVSESFTGSDYDTAVSAVGNPTTLERVLAKVKQSFGTIDFDVLIGTLSVSLQAAFSGLAGVFYNVKDLDYGATGDGTTDDLRGIQSAINAADAAGGGLVFLPPGTYLVSAELYVPDSVSLLGCGAQLSVIKVTSGLARAIHFWGYGAAGAQRLEKIGVRASVAHSASLVTAVRGANLVIRSCSLGDANCTGPLFELQNTNIASGSERSRVRISWTEFVAGGTDEDDLTFGRCIASYAAAATARLDVANCTFISPATCGTVDGITMVRGLCVHLRDCEFDHSLTTAGAIYDSDQGTSGAWGSVIGCRFSEDTSGTIVQVHTKAVMTSSADWLCEIGNLVEGSDVNASGTVQTACRDITQSDTSTSAGYYLKATSTWHYGESDMPGIVPSANVFLSSISHATPRGITAVDFTKVTGSGHTRVVSSRSALGDAFTYVGYSCGFARTNYASDSTDATLTYHSAVPSIDPSVGSGYFGMKMRMVRTYGLPGPTLRTKWYCFGVGGSTKTGLARTSY